MKYIKAIMEPVLIFLRENDGNLKKAPGNSIGHAYFNFYQIDQFYKNSETIKPIHRTALSKILNERWVFGHNKLHSAAFVVHPFYRTYKQDQNPEVMGDFFDLLDCWCTQDVKVEVLKQLMTYRNGLGMFARSETSQLVNDPISFSHSGHCLGAQRQNYKHWLLKFFSKTPQPVLVKQTGRHMIIFLIKRGID